MNNNFRIYFSLFLLLSTLVSGIYSQCKIDIQKDLNGTENTIREPVFFNFTQNRYELMIPVDGEIKFKNGETALILCASDGKANALTLNQMQSATIACSSVNKFKINNQLHSITDCNECSASITGNVIERDRTCGKDGKFYNIGYQLPSNLNFVNLIDICYSQKRASAIYSAHVIHGKTIKNPMKASQRPASFKTNEVPSKIKAASLFTKAKQKERLTELIGSRKATEYMEKTFLARGHLSPDGDMIFVSWQWTTYYYINVVPQWQSINNGNWKHVEFAIRTKAGNLRTNLVVFTGGYQVLELDGTKITLDDQGLEVPKWSWKVVKDSKTGKGIAFVTYNNPFAESTNDLCTDICKSSNWDWKERKNFAKGYTICCNVSNIMNVIKDIPAVANTTGILTF